VISHQTLFQHKLGYCNI